MTDDAAVGLGRVLVRRVPLRAVPLSLAEANWKEKFCDQQPQIDWAQYQALEDSGVLLLVAAYRGDEVIGYAAGAKLPLLNLGSTLLEGLVVYVRPECRGRSTARELVHTLRLCAFDDGVTKTRWHASCNARLGSLLKSLGYSVTEEVWTQ